MTTYLTRQEAAEYLSAKGAPYAKNTLQKFASIGGGPVYRRIGNKTLYAPADLDRWFEEKMSPPITSTSDLFARVQAGGC